MHVVDKRDGMARDGCTRVAFYKLFNLKHCYTLESNYISGRWPARKLQPHNTKFIRETEPNWLANLQEAKSGSGSPSGVYTDEFCWLEVGAGLAVSVLDLFQLMPKYFSRVPMFNRIYEATERSLPSYVRGVRTEIKVQRNRSSSSLKNEKSNLSKKRIDSAKNSRKLKPITRGGVSKDKSTKTGSDSSRKILRMNHREPINNSDSPHIFSESTYTDQLEPKINNLINITDTNLNKYSRNCRISTTGYAGTISGSSKSSTESRTSTQKKQKKNKTTNLSVKPRSPNYKASKYTTSKVSIEKYKTPMKVIASDVGDTRALASIVQGHFESSKNLTDQDAKNNDVKNLPLRMLSNKNKTIRDSRKYIGDLGNLNKKFESINISGEMSISSAKLRFKRVPEIQKLKR